MRKIRYIETYPKRRLWEKTVANEGESAMGTPWECMKTWEAVDNDPHLLTQNSRKELVSGVIDKVLLKISRSCFEKVTEQLHIDYNCQISDCYETPEYLKRILTEYYGNGSKAIIDSIYVELWDYATNQNIGKFLNRISK